MQEGRLEPNTRYRYRFYYGDAHSKTGRRWCSRQDWALRDPARAGREREQRTLRLHLLTGLHQRLLPLPALPSVRGGGLRRRLGDYIYETVGEESFQGGGPEERQFLFPKNGRRDDRCQALNLADYRFAYKKYRTDPYLQEVHEKVAFVTIWNDHEFANDCHQTLAPDASTGTTLVPRRRENANQAWAEYTPTGMPYKPGEGPMDEIRSYRSFAFGDLTERVMTDERVYHDGPPCGNELTARYLAPGCGEEGEENPGAPCSPLSEERLLS